MHGKSGSSLRCLRFPLWLANNGKPDRLLFLLPGLLKLLLVGTAHRLRAPSSLPSVSVALLHFRLTTEKWTIPFVLAWAPPTHPPRFSTSNSRGFR
jgi:hypothetical protein